MLQLCRGKFSWQRNFVVNFIWLKLNVIYKKRKKSPFQPPFGNLGVTYALHLYLVGKPVVKLPIHHNWTFFAISYGWDVINGNLSKSAFFEGVGHFEHKFQMQGTSPTNHCWCQKMGVIALSCSVKISTVHCLVMSQSTRGWTDGQTALRQLILQYHSCSHGKNSFNFNQYSFFPVKSTQHSNKIVFQNYVVV